MSIITGNIYGQKNSLFTNLKDSLGQAYGLNPILYNGKLYKYFSPKSIIGNQYLHNESFVQSEATIRGNKFKNLNLNYDIFNQELLLKYIGQSESENIIELSKAYLEEFTLGESRFKLCILNDFPERIYQVIGSDSVQIYYFAKKVLKLNNQPGTSNYSYELRKSSYVLINKSLHQYTGTKSFIKLFDRDIQPLLKKYIKSNKIKVAKASDKSMEQLVNYCNSILK